MSFVEIKGLTKKFGKFTALNNINLSMNPGEIYGFIGLNGAGKSTTIRVLLGMLKPTAGQVTIMGKDAWKDAVEIHKRVAYVPGDVNLWPNLTGGEIIYLFLSMRGNDSLKKRDELIERFDLDPSKKCRMYSKGNRQKVALISAFATEMLLFTAIAVVIMNILFVSSSTRRDEEEGRLEMIRALPTGRLSYLMASGIMILMVNVLLGVLTGVGIGLFGQEWFTWEDSLLYGGILGATGLCFAGITSFFAQLSDTSRGTSNLSFGALIVFYIVRAIGDVSAEGLALISPLGWTVRTGVFVDNHWWPVLALTICGALFATLAFILNMKRDIYAGLLPTKPGRVRAPRYLKTSLGLTWRLERSTIISWTIGIFLMSAAFGTILGDLETHFSDMEYLQAFLPQGNDINLSQSFITLLIQIMSVFTAIPAVSIILKLKKDEKRGFMENFYSRAVSRSKIMGSYATIALLSTIAMQITIAIGLYLTSMGAMEELLDLSSIIAEVLVYLPAIWVLMAIALLLVGLWPKGTGLVWLYTVFVFMVLYLGNTLNFPEWLNNLSALTHIPDIAQDKMNWTPILELSALALLFSCIGFTSYNRRDIQ